MSAGIGARVEGFHAVAAAAAAGRVQELFVERRRLARPAVAALVEQAESSGASVEVVEDVGAHAETQVPQGLVATARPIPTATVDELVAEHAPAALLVLDHLLDPHNVGAIARSALAGGVPRLVVSGRRAAPLGATAFKAAAGALEHVRVAVAGSTAQVITRLEELGVWTVGLSANADQSLFGLSLLAEPVALVVGGEGAGLSRLVAERVDLTVRIPMTSGSESLNASAAAVLAVFEVTRVRSGPPTQTLSRP